MEEMGDMERAPTLLLVPLNILSGPRLVRLGDGSCEVPGSTGQKGEGRVMDGGWGWGWG